MEDVRVVVSGREAVALEESRRGLDKQNDDLSRLRDRSMTLVSAGGVAAGLVVGFRPKDAGITGFTWAGLVAFVGVAIVAVMIAWPSQWRMNQSAKIITDWVDDQNPSLDAVHRDLAIHLETEYDTYEGWLALLTRAYAGALVLFLAEVALLLIDVRN
jgi:hypothetical protein